MCGQFKKTIISIISTMKDYNIWSSVANRIHGKILGSLSLFCHVLTCPSILWKCLLLQQHRSQGLLECSNGFLFPSLIVDKVHQHILDLPILIRTRYTTWLLVFTLAGLVYQFNWTLRKVAEVLVHSHFHYYSQGVVSTLVQTHPPPHPPFHPVPTTLDTYITLRRHTAPA